MKLQHHYNLRVVLESSHNEYLSYPCEGILQVIEMGLDYKISQAVFRQIKNESVDKNILDENIDLKCPVVVHNPDFSYVGR